MIEYNTPNTNFYQIRPDDDMWWMNDGVRIVPRAAIEIDSRCPNDLALYVRRAISAGHIKPVAYMNEKEYVWATLEK